MFRDTAFLKNIKHCAGSRRHQRIAAIGGAVVARNHCAGRLAPCQEGTYGKPVSQRLGHCHHVRLHAVMLPGKHFPGTAHAALDFIQYKEQVVFIAQGPDPF